jgi:hypothetical protein
MKRAGSRRALKRGPPATMGRRAPPIYADPTKTMFWMGAALFFRLNSLRQGRAAERKACRRDGLPRAVWAGVENAPRGMGAAGRGAALDKRRFPK